MPCFTVAVSCNPRTAFQCYDGSCIPKDRQCDGMVDCPGSFKEDENLHCAQQEFETCQDYFKQGYTENGKYKVNPGGLGM